MVLNSENYLLVTLDKFDEDLWQVILKIALDAEIFVYSANYEKTSLLFAASSEVLEDFHQTLKDRKFPVFVTKVSSV